MGGGVHCQNGASPTIENCVFAGNQGKAGGGFSCIGGSPTLVGCVFVGNHAYELDGGGALCADGAEPAFIDCFFADNTTVGGGAGLAASSSRVELSGCTFVRNASSPYNGGGAIYCGWGSTVSAATCTFAGNSSPDGAGALCYPDGTLLLSHSVIAFSAQGQAIALYGSSTATLSCCDLYGNPGGDWVGAIAGQFGVDGNISADPLFCDAALDDYHLQPGSPCLPQSSPNPECALIGAWPVGCSWMGVAEAPVPGATLRIVPPIASPGRGPVRVVFELPAEWGPQLVRLAVYDSAGRQVGLLADGPRRPGRHELLWAPGGADGGRAAGVAAGASAAGASAAGAGAGAGARLASGVYHCRLTTAGGAASRTLIVLR